MDFWICQITLALFLGSLSPSHITAGRALDDGKWHELRWLHQFDSVQLTIDGVVLNQTTPTGLYRKLDFHNQVLFSWVSMHKRVCLRKHCSSWQKQWRTCLQITMKTRSFRQWHGLLCKYLRERYAIIHSSGREGCLDFRATTRVIIGHLRFSGCVQGLGSSIWTWNDRKRYGRKLEYL